MQVKAIDYNWLVQAWFKSHDIDVSMTREASRFQQIFVAGTRHSTHLTCYAMLLAELHHLPQSNTWSYWELVLKHAFPMEYGHAGLEGVISWLKPLQCIDDPEIGVEEIVHDVMDGFVNIIDKAVVALATRDESQLQCAPSKDKAVLEGVEMLTDFLARAGNHLRSVSEAAHDNSKSST